MDLENLRKLFRGGLFVKQCKKPLSLISLFLFLLLVNSAFAERNASAKSEGDLKDITITGKVKDESAAPLPGVNILEKGTQNGTITDSEGNFTLSVASRESLLVFSFIGMTTEEVIVGNQTNISVNLLGDVSTLMEIVVTGYGTQEKKDITGSITSLKQEDFNMGIINSPEQLLQGKVSGLNVTSVSGEPGAKQNITVRGPGSIRQGSTPLFVVDGFALDNSSTGGDANPLNFINPQDIESIDVLKDASATAIYGSRGSNGVVIITTKKGKAGQTTLNYSTSYGISTMANKIDVYGADEFRTIIPAIGGTLDDMGGSTDWQKEVTRTAYTQNHNISLGGGSDKLTYYASLGLQDQDGIIKESNFKRYTGRLNVSQKFLEDDRLQLDLNLTATNTVSAKPNITDIIGSALSMNPTYRAYDENGDPYNFSNFVNPLIKLKWYDDITNTTRILGNISPSIKIIKGLVYRLNFGIDHSTADNDIQQIPSADPVQKGRLDAHYNKNRNTLLENYLTYNFEKGDHNFGILAGHSYQKIFVQKRYWSISTFPDNGVEPIYNPGQGQEFNFSGDGYNPSNKPSGSATENELQSFFGRINYSFNSRYLFTATVRADGSSKFGKNNKYGTFPSFALGWRISEEPFMQSLPFTDLKLRAGWGQTGNQEIPPKITQALYKTEVSSGSSYPLSPTGAFPAGTVFSRLANPDIQWEVSTQTNIGLDFGIIRGALYGSVDLFKKVSNNILLDVTPPDPIQAADSYWKNIKDMTITNKGVETSLNYQYNNVNGFSYGVGGNVTFIDNKVEDSPYTLITSGTASGSGLTSSTINGYVNGEPIGTFFMPEFIGIGENGKSIYKDIVPPDTVTSAGDRVAAGSALPTTMYSFYGNASYKGFDVSFTFNGVSGNKIYDNTATTLFYKNLLAKSNNTTSEVAKYPNESTSNSASVSTRYLKDGAYLRLNNVSLGYSFNTESLRISRYVKSFRLSVTGQNLFVITDYDGYDPEVDTDKSVEGVTSYGIDYLSYPKARTILFGLNVSF